MRIRGDMVLVGAPLADARLWQRRGRSCQSVGSCRMIALILREGRE